MVEQGFAELAKRWKPILDAFDDAGVDACYEIHPGEDLHDGASFEQFLKAVDNHPRANILFDPSHFVLQHLDYLDFIDRYHSRIKMFHVKDAEFNPNGRNGVYGGYQDWQDRAGRFSLVDFKGILSQMASQVLEWECCLKDSAQGAAEGAPFIASHIIEPSKYAFDDFAGGDVSEAKNNRILPVSAIILM